MADDHLIKLQETIMAVYGNRGLTWWANLPYQLELLSKEHELTLLSPFQGLSFNYVQPVIGPNQEAWVLKCGVPNDELTSEVAALRHYDGIGAVRLINADVDAGWMLVERCVPGCCLVDLSDEKQTIAIAVSVMHRLWRPVENPDQFPTLARWLRGLDHMKANPFLKDVLSKALRGFADGRAQELLLSQGEPVLLHADLHHYNILQHQDTWIAIDPKGVVGEREFEIGAFLRNPLCVVEDPIETQAIARNLDQVIELTGFDRQKVLSWSIIQAVLCVCWFSEDNMELKARQLAVFTSRLYSLL
ncbi:MAG: aminoglycoside phosphotransferase family protein [Legionellaceae bacterium]|nr:aminoglycoside phosphotransferase family protein [Legionellaceae bacterium]